MKKDIKKILHDSFKRTQPGDHLVYDITITKGNIDILDIYKTMLITKYMDRAYSEKIMYSYTFDNDGIDISKLDIDELFSIAHVTLSGSQVVAYRFIKSLCSKAKSNKEFDIPETEDLPFTLRCLSKFNCVLTNDNLNSEAFNDAMLYISYVANAIIDETDDVDGLDVDEDSVGYHIYKMFKEDKQKLIDKYPEMKW